MRLKFSFFLAYEILQLFPPAVGASISTNVHVPNVATVSDALEYSSNDAGNYLDLYTKPSTIRWLQGSLTPYLGQGPAYSMCKRFVSNSRSSKDHIDTRILHTIMVSGISFVLGLGARM